MKPVLIQTLIKHNRKNKPVPKLDEQLYADTNTPLAKFVFWGLAAIIVLSLLLA